MAVFAWVAGMSTSLPVAAHDARAPQARDLPRIVVTATRSAHDPRDVAASIDTVDLDATPDAPRIGLSELLAGIPGVLARNRQNHAQDEQISIRGFGARSTFGVRGVRLYVDGIPATMPDGQGQVSHFNLDSAARIEVLRGPFSALYGNSSGGVIQLFSADGSAPPEFDVGMARGGDGLRRASANARGRQGAFDYNVDVTHFRTDGYRDHSRARRDSGNARLGWRIGDGTLTLSANSLSLPQAQDPLGLTRAQFDASPRGVADVAKAYDTRKSVAQNQLGTIWEQDLGGGHSLRLLGYRGEREVEQYLAVPKAAQGSPLHSGGVIDLGGDYGGSDLRWRWNGELAGRAFELVAGLAWDRQQQRRRGYENFVGDTLGVRGALRRDEIDTVRDFDQYAQAGWQIAEAWTLSAGLRHSDVRFDSADRYITAPNPDDSGRVGYRATTPVAGLLWRATPTAHVYAAWGRGFETPAFNELAYRADGRAGLAFDLAAARTRNAEIGLKLRPNAHLDANLVLFRADTRDELSVATSSGGRATYHTIGRSRREGVEAALAWRFAPDWRLHAAYTGLDARFRTPFSTCAGMPCTPTTVAAGARIPGIARHRLHLALDWGGEQGWRASVAADAVGAVAVDDLGSDHAPAHVVAALDVGYGIARPGGDWRAFARVDNLFDRRYAGSVIVNDANGRWFEPASGRTLMLGTRWTWRR